jgi:hypothetical protein
MPFTSEQYETAKRLAEILMPYAVARQESFVQRNGRFVHYTSAESALKIINSKSMWMRNTKCMSDFSEIMHGFQTLNNHEQTKALITAFNTLPDVGPTGVNLFNTWWNDTQYQTFITSISEHDEGEDDHGRLSMWRAFARASARVGLVFKIPLTPSFAESLNLVISPVAYFTHEQLGSELATVIANVNRTIHYLRSADRDLVVGSIFQMLVLATACLKHQGFHEEREWRVIYWPKRRPSDLMASSVEVVDGVPQIVYKIPLSGGPPPDLAGLAIPQLVDRVIIGPSPYPWPMYEAFTAALAGAGVKDAGARVFVSGIPIRT